MTLGPVISDVETNGFLETLTKMHSLVVRDATSGELLVSGSAGSPGSIGAALDALNEAEAVIGHNFLKFDAPAIEKVFPSFRLPRQKILDTFILGKVLWPDLKTGDFLRFKKHEMPGQHIGNHSLEAWGYRLGEFKGEYTDWCAANGITDPWAEWRPEMQSYCDQDTLVNWKLWQRIAAKKLDPRCVALEHQTAILCNGITEAGWPFDVPAATELYAKVLEERDNRTKPLQAMFPPIERKTVFIPKVNNRKLGYQKGVPIERITIEEFNPGSREEIAERLISKYKWEPQVFTDGGKKGLKKPQIDETIIGQLPYPEAPLLGEYLALDKIASFFAGKQADKGWLRLEQNGLIHGEYDTAGAVTGRATHKRPNIAQVPSVSKGKDKKVLLGLPGGYGWELRSLFGVPKGWMLVGADMSGLELRCLGHYMAAFDAGAYITLVCEGDVHTANMLAAGLTTREIAKTFIYAFLYGAGAWKLGHTADSTLTDDQKKALGTKLLKNFLDKTPALKKLREAVMDTVEKYGNLIGLDGRPLTVRKKHAALNTLLQSAGAILCKRWITETFRVLREDHGLCWGWDGDFVFCAWVHDELQIACRTPEIAQLVARVAVEQCAKAGEFFKFKCPLTGEAKIGTNWAETH